MEPIEPKLAVPEDEGSILAFTEGVRKQVVNTLVKDGRIPTDKDDVKTLFAALDGLDRSAIGRLRIKLEKETNDHLANATQVIGHLMNQIDHDLYRAKTLPGEVLAPRELEDAPMELIQIVEASLIEGELDSSYRQESIDEFTERMLIEHPVD